MKIGIDIGNVIIGGDGEDTFFSDNFLETPEVRDAFKSIREIIEAGNEVFLISKCGAIVQSKTLQWLKFYEFSGRTGFTDTPYFVYHRMDKAPVARALDLLVFIDDRMDVLDSMGRVRYPLLFTSWEETMKDLRELGFV
jgi:hypothetical protein